MSRGRLSLVGGGARSGKSSFALRLATSYGRRCAYVATALPSDGEMQTRIALHRAERADRFDTLEAPYDLPAALDTLTRYDVVLIDCLTVYLSNLLLQFEAEAQEKTEARAPSSSIRPAEAPWSEFDGHSSCLSIAATRATAEVSRLANRLLEFEPRVILVTNEVGAGIVPEYELGRVFRDLAGRANQTLAAQATEIYFSLLGQVLRLRPMPLVVVDEREMSAGS